MREINFIVIHCSATQEGRDFKEKDIDLWHRARGWNGCGYHYVIDLDGTVEKGRDENAVGAHVSGHNKDSIGICYIGGLDLKGNPKDTRTQKQKDAMFDLIFLLKQKYPKAKLMGHCDFPGVNKACPCFDVRKWYTSELQSS